MIRLLKSFKTEINPTEEQKIKIHKTIGTCRYIYNFYLFHNKELYTLGKKFMSGKSFSVWLNNDYLPNHQEYSWIREVSSKSVKHSIEDSFPVQLFQDFSIIKVVFHGIRKKDDRM